LARPGDRPGRPRDPQRGQGSIGPTWNPQSRQGFLGIRRDLDRCEGPKITLVAIGAFFPVYTTVSAALSHLDPALVEVGTAYGLQGVGLLGKILLPAAAPSVVSGLRLGLAQGWLFLVAAELIGSSMGLGFLLTDSQNTGRTDIILLAIVLLALLGKATDAILGVLERRVVQARV
jgi:sulfonate transport system permease protein